MRRKKDLPSHERFKADFPTRLRDLMGKQEKTHQDVADYLGKSRQTVGFYANGTSSPDWETIVLLAQYFGVTTDYLLGLSDYTKVETANLTASQMGLSEQAAINLTDLHQSQSSTDKVKLRALNLIIEDDGIAEQGAQLLRNIARYLYASEIPHQMLHFTTEGVQIAATDDLSPADLDFDISNHEYANILFSQLLESRVIESVRGARYQLHHTIMKPGQKGSGTNGKL